MNGGTAGGANFLGAKLTRAKFTNVDFATLRPEIGYANLDQAADLQDAVFENVRGVSEYQIERCKWRGAQFLGEVVVGEPKVTEKSRSGTADPPGSPIARSEGGAESRVRDRS
jgi:uncharacterized protein YjbI with pentapeptide repeats